MEKKSEVVTLGEVFGMTVCQKKKIEKVFN